MPNNNSLVKNNEKTLPKKTPSPVVSKLSNSKSMKKKRKKVTKVSLRTFLLLCNTSFILLFFLIVLYLLSLQNETITLRSNLQIQGEVSRLIVKQVAAYFQAATNELRGIHALVESSLTKTNAFDPDSFYTFAEAIIKQDQGVSALYYGDKDGSLYMVKRTQTGAIGRKSITNDGKIITERWEGLSGEALEGYLPEQTFTLAEGYDHRSRDWYQLAKLKEETWVGPYIFHTDKFAGMTGVKAVQVGDNYGVIGIDIKTSDVNKSLQELPFSKTGYIVIKTIDGKLVAISDKNRIDYDVTEYRFSTQDDNRLTEEIGIRDVTALDSSEAMRAFSRKVLPMDNKQLKQLSVWKDNMMDRLLVIFFPRDAKSSNIRNIIMEGIDYGTILLDEKNFLFTYNNFTPSKNTNWQVYTFTDAMNISNSLGHLSQILTGIFAGFVLLFIMILQYVSKMVSHPLGRLSQMMDDFSKHLVLDKDFCTRKGRIEIDEIDNIGNVYNNLQNGFRSFKRFVPDVVVKRSMNSAFLGNSQLHSNMGKKQISILFSDIEGFTSISERIEPKVLCDCLEVYFSAMCQEIGNNDGLIDKFIGDAIMALFGAFNTEDDIENLIARQAITAALNMRNKAQQINQEIQRIDPSVQFRTRIGISTGDAMVGVLGSKQRLNFTAIGDRVNLASRLESVNKKYGTDIIVSEHSKELTEDVFVFRYLGSIQVRGKVDFEKIYEPIDLISNVSDYYKGYYRNFGQLQTILEEGDPERSKKAVQLLREHFPTVDDHLLNGIIETHLT